MHRFVVVRSRHKSNSAFLQLVFRDEMILVKAAAQNVITDKISPINSAYYITHFCQGRRVDPKLVVPARVEFAVLRSYDAVPCRKTISSSFLSKSDALNAANILAI